MIITEEKTVAEIVTENIKTAAIFKKHGIDFCCGGGISLEKVCKKNDDKKLYKKLYSEIEKTVVKENKISDLEFELKKVYAFYINQLITNYKDGDVLNYLHLVDAKDCILTS